MRPPRALAALELKLPLLISGLLALVIGGFSWGAYTEVRNVTLGAAGEHLERVTTQLVASLNAGGPQRAVEVRQLAEQLVIRTYLVHPEGPARAAAQATLERLTSRDTLYAAAELWNAAGERVLAVGRPLPPADSAATHELTASVSDSSTAIGPLRVIGDSLLFPVIAAVTVGGTRTGYVVNWRRVQASPAATRRFTELIGADAALLVDNIRGDAWTDLSARVGGPPVDVRGRPDVIEYARPGRGIYLARAAPIGGTPWILVVELPRDRVLAPVRSFLGRITVLALALIAVGTVGAWAVSHRTRRRLEAEVAERARAEQSLLDTAARLRSLMDNASDGIAVLSPDGIVLEINRSMSTILGLPPDQVIDRHIEVFAVPGTAAANTQRFVEAVQRGGGHLLGVELQRGDGRTAVVDFSVGIVNVRGERLVLSIGRDVTEQRSLEQQLRRAQKMEAIGRWREAWPTTSTTCSRRFSVTRI